MKALQRKHFMHMHCGLVDCETCNLRSCSRCFHRNLLPSPLFISRGVRTYRSKLFHNTAYHNINFHCLQKLQILRHVRHMGKQHVMLVIINKSRGICGGHSGAGAGFLRVLQFPLPIFITRNSPSSQSPGAGTRSGRRAEWTQFRLHPPPCELKIINSR
jgi:hypothetical protein